MFAKQAVALQGFCYNWKSSESLLSDMKVKKVISSIEIGAPSQKVKTLCNSEDAVIQRNPHHGPIDIKTV